MESKSINGNKVKYIDLSNDKVDKLLHQTLSSSSFFYEFQSLNMVKRRLVVEKY